MNLEDGVVSTALCQRVSLCVALGVCWVSPEFDTKDIYLIRNGLTRVGKSKCGRVCALALRAKAGPMQPRPFPLCHDHAIRRTPMLCIEMDRCFKTPRPRKRGKRARRRLVGGACHGKRTHTPRAGLQRCQRAGPLRLQLKPDSRFDFSSVLVHLTSS